MGLATNTCKKHGGHVEDECPKCVEEEYQKAVDEMKTFFQQRDQYWVRLRRGSREEAISIEELFQHFRVRLLEEIGS